MVVWETTETGPLGSELRNVVKYPFKSARTPAAFPPSFVPSVKLSVLSTLKFPILLPVEPFEDLEIVKEELTP